jgi:release factor glutamine methyltransferase
MQVQEAFIKLRHDLSVLYDERESDQIAHWVIEHLTGLSRSGRLLHKTDTLTSEQETSFLKYLTELLQWRPVQYVLGEAWFAGMKFYVDERVLIPRPETEELVELVVVSQESGVGNQQPSIKKNQPLLILDIGTGSGCIPIAIKKKRPAWDVWGADLSEDALVVAKQNAKSLGTDIHFIQVDILDENSRDILPVFDIIVSNPPYIPLKDQAEMRENVVQHEPHLALFVCNDDPLLFYKEIIHFAKDHLSPGGRIFCEIHEKLAKQVELLLLANNFLQIVTRKDMQGKDRMISAV